MSVIRKMFDCFPSYLFAAYFFISSALFVTGAMLVCAVTAPFDRNRRLVHLYASVWGYHYICLNPFWHCTIEGRENIHSHGTFVLVANHQSLWDIMVLYGLYMPFKWVAKESVMKMPFIGLNMLLNQYVRVLRGDLRSIKHMMAECRRWLLQGASIMIFPEGTRSHNGEMGAFHDGPFKLAVECKVPVIPIVIDGTFQIFSKGATRINFAQKISVKVLPPIEPERFQNDFRALREGIKQAMAMTLAELRNPDGQAAALTEGTTSRTRLSGFCSMRHD